MKNKIILISFLTLTSLLLVSCNSSRSRPRKLAYSPPPGAYQRLDPILRLDSGGHSGVIWDLAATADGKYLVSASADKTIRIWDVQTGLEVRKILGWLDRGDTGIIHAVALSPDNKLLAVGGVLTKERGQPIRVYDFASGKLLRVFEAHENVVHDLAFSPDGRYLVSGSADFSVKVWDAGNNFESVHIFKEHQDHVYAVGVFKHGKDYRIVSGGYDNQVFLYSLNLKKVLASYSRRNRVKSLAVAPSYIAFASGERRINIFDPDLKLIKTLKSETNSAALAFSPDGKLLLSGTVSTPVKCNVYSAEEGFKKIQSFSQHDNLVRAAIFLDNRTAATGGGSDNIIYFWNPISGEIKDRLEGKGKAVWTVGIKGENLVWGVISEPRSQNYLGEWEKRFNLKNFSIDRPSKFTGFQRMASKYKGYSLNHAKGGKYDYEDAILEIRAPGSKIVSIIRGAADGYRHRTYGFTSKGVVVSGGDGGVLTAHNLQGQKLADLVGHIGEIWSLGTDEHWLASGGRDQVIKLWDLRPLEKEQTKIYPTLNIFAGDDDEWAVWTEEGFFMTSPLGGKYVGYHINQGKGKEARYISVDQLYHAFHRPELVRAKLAGRDISGFARHMDIRKILDNGGLPPKIKILTPDGFSKTRNISLEAELCDRGGGIGDFLFKLNGRPRRLSRSEFNFKPVRTRVKDMACPNKQLAVKKLPVSLIDERAVISLSAYNYANSIRGDADEIRIDFPNPVRRRADLHILTVAIDRYEDADLRLNHARADAQALTDVLREKAAPLFANIKVYPVYDPVATRTGIEKKFREAASEIKAEDLFVLFMSGHGKVYDKTGEYYFLPMDFEYSHEDALPEQGVSADDLSRWVGMIEAEKALFMLDTCHSKRAMTAMEIKFPATSRGLGKKEAIQKLAWAVGKSFMAAGGDKREDKIALEGERYQGHGAFSWVILQGLLGKKIKTTHKGKQIIIEPDKNNNGYITVGELADFVRKALPKVTLEKSLYKQVPYVPPPRDDDYPISVPDYSYFSTSKGD